MDIDEPVKTACGQTLREATGTITLHISASLSADNVSYDLASVDADLPITVEVVNNNGTIMPKVDSVASHESSPQESTHSPTPSKPDHREGR